MLTRRQRLARLAASIALVVGAALLLASAVLFHLRNEREAAVAVFVAGLAGMLEGGRLLSGARDGAISLSRAEAEELVGRALASRRENS